MFSKADQALKAYQQVNVQGGASDEASPQELIQMLLDGAVDRISTAKGAMERKETAKKGENISKAVMIVDALHGCLDGSHNSDLAGTLASLYDYMSRRLTEANLRNDVEALDEVASLLNDLRDAWSKLPPNQKQDAAHADSVAG